MCMMCIVIDMMCIYIYNVYDMIGEIKPFPRCLLYTGSRLKTVATDRGTPPKKRNSPHVSTIF